MLAERLHKLASNFIHGHALDVPSFEHVNKRAVPEYCD
jgi:hypothetical protein